MQQISSDPAGGDSYDSNPKTPMKVSVKEVQNNQTVDCWSPVSVASSQSAASPYSSPMAVPQAQSSKPIDFIDQIFERIQKEAPCYSGYETHSPPESSTQQQQQCLDIDPLARANALALAIHRFTPQVNLPIEGAIFSTMHDQAYDTVMVGSIFESECSAFSYHRNVLPTTLRNYSMEFEKAIENETIWYQNDLNEISASLEIPSVSKIFAGASPFSRNLPPSRTSLRIFEPRGPTSFSPDSALARPPQQYSAHQGYSSLPLENNTEKDVAFYRTLKRERDNEPGDGRIGMEDMKRIRVNVETPRPMTQFDSQSASQCALPTAMLPRYIYSGKSLPQSSPSPQISIETKMDQSHLFHSPVLVPGRRSKLPMRVVTHLRHFFLENIRHPYPNDNQKQVLARETNLKIKQISDWFTNNRKRYYRTFEKHLISIKCQLSNKRKGHCECGGKHNPPVHHWRMMWE